MALSLRCDPHCTVPSKVQNSVCAFNALVRPFIQAGMCLDAQTHSQTIFTNSAENTYSEQLEYAFGIAVGTKLLSDAWCAKNTPKAHVTQCRAHIDECILFIHSVCPIIDAIGTNTRCSDSLHSKYTTCLFTNCFSNLRVRWSDAGWVWEQCNITHKYAICILANCGLLRLSHASTQDSSTSDDIMSNAAKQLLLQYSFIV